MDQLKAQLAELEGQKEKLFENDTVDQTEVSQLNEKIAAVQKQLDELTAQQAQIEEKVNSDGIPFAISNVDFTKLPAEFITAMDLILKADRRRIYAEQATTDASAAKIATQKDADYAAYKEQAEQRIATLTEDYKSIEDELLQSRAETRQETADKLQAFAERDEARTNRDNAVAQLDEAKQEIKRLNSQVDDYQKAKVFGEREAQNIIEVEASEASDINDALQRLYTKFENYGNINLVYKPDGSTEQVKSDALLSEWTKVPAGGSETSQGTFPEVPTAVAEVGGVLDTETALTPPPFQGEVQDAHDAVGGEPIDTTVAPVTRGEFEELKARVAQLENGQVGAAA